jgi:SAM-dependent methyltransferase
MPLERIDLVEQHRKYAPNDSGLQHKLTVAAQRSAVGYVMHSCESCGLEWATPMSAPGEDWYSLAYQHMNLYPDTRWEFEYVLAACPPDAVVFDIGCGGGAFLRRCTAAGIHAEGADFSQASIDACVREGLHARRLDLSMHIERNERTANVVTAFQTIEHLSKPRTLFELASTVSRRNAMLWVGVPSPRRPSRIFGESDYLDEPPHHLTRWTETALRTAGERSGWKLEQTMFEPLALAAALWCISTRTRLYQLVRGTSPGLLDSTRERLARLLHSPLALLQRLTVYRSMTGFSMLACFRKDAPP